MNGTTTQHTAVVAVTHFVTVVIDGAVNQAEADRLADEFINRSVDALIIGEGLAHNRVTAKIKSIEHLNRWS